MYLMLLRNFQSALLEFHRIQAPCHSIHEALYIMVVIKVLLLSESQSIAKKQLQKKNKEAKTMVQIHPWYKSIDLNFSIYQFHLRHQNSSCTFSILLSVPYFLASPQCVSSLSWFF